MLLILPEKEKIFVYDILFTGSADHRFSCILWLFGSSVEQSFLSKHEESYLMTFIQVSYI